MLSIVVAKAKNNIIGKDNKMIWHLPEDLKHFKELTTGHAIIMGRKTFESLGKVLPDRKHIVFTQNPDFKVNDKLEKLIANLDKIVMDFGGHIYRTKDAMSNPALTDYLQQIDSPKFESMQNERINRFKQK